MAITLTAAAARQVQTIIKENALVDHVVRVTVKVDPDSANFDYELDIVDEIHDDDRTIEADGVKVVCDPRSWLWVKGTEIDYSAAGFKFNNPLER